mgnify:CR=1 FL=1
MTVVQVQTNIPLFLLLSTTIFFTAIGCEWFYQGVEDFKYVAVRGLIVKVVSVILLFLLVKTKEDILWYGAYSVLGFLVETFSTSFGCGSTCVGVWLVFIRYAP